MASAADGQLGQDHAEPTTPQDIAQCPPQSLALQKQMTPHKGIGPEGAG